MKRFPFAVKIGLLAMVAILALASTSLSAMNNQTPPIGQPDPSQYHSQPQHPVTNLPPSTDSLNPDAVVPHLGVSSLTAARQMRMLVVTATGQEPSFAAITMSLDKLGVPYQTLVAAQQSLTPDFLVDSATGRGNYQAVILTTGNLGYEYQPGQWGSAFTAEEWQSLWNYEAQYGVRQATLYTYPSNIPVSYGLTLLTDVDTTNTPLQATLTADGQALFPYINRTAVIPIQNAWTYLADPEPGATPLLQTAGGATLMALKTFSDGRENLAMTFDHNPYLRHTQLLLYGVVDWLTRGIFQGQRKVYLNLQVDDLLIADDMWDVAALSDQTGLEYRLTADDLNATTAWKNQLQTQPAFPGWTFEWALNGSGGAKNDPLSNAVKSAKSEYRWINHTWDHMNLDASTFDETKNQLRRNNDFAANWKLTGYKKNVLVTPDVSGLQNPEAMQAIREQGVKYVVCDTSRANCQGMAPNTGIYNPLQPSILMIPRRPTNLFYNTSTPEELTSEYNNMYRWYWGRDLTYAELLDKESDVYLSYMLGYDINPLMFHQPNLRAYDGTHTLLSDVVDQAAAKFNALVNLPVVSLPMANVGAQMAQRMTLNAAGATAVLYPGQRVEVTATADAIVPVTGLSTPNAEQYGSEVVTWVKAKAGQTVSVNIGS